ncbi:MAG: hypothetical protein IKL36_05335 [Clostridia bacterium]|nr:hypothetical protein [Clostridia bacterium]
MKKQKREIMKDPRQLKQKLMAVISMLVVAGVLLSTVTFAWLVMSISPEVRGVTTNVGANGSLEIALLNSSTRQDLSTIQGGGVGSSLANNSLSANYTWGNLIDVSDVSFGLDDITLMPARISTTANEDGTGFIVNSGMLSVPEYGFDGRIIKLNNNTISAVYGSNKFSYTYGVQEYGVRAIGTASALTAQGSALATAKSNITTYKNSANNTMVNTWNKNGADLFQLLLDHAMASGGTDTYDDADLAVIETMLVDLNNSVNYIDLSLRYGLVAFAAANIAEESDFISVRDYILVTSNSISDILAKIAENNITLPDEFSTWVDKLGLVKANLANAASACNLLEGGTYSWAEISQPLRYIMNTESVYIDEYAYKDMNMNVANSLMGKDGFTLTLAPGSGAFADIADFAEDINTTFTAIGKAMTVKTLSSQQPAYLVVLSYETDELEAAGGAEGTTIDITSTFGYALDLAFRCNASGTSKLLLQTTPEQRVYEDSTAASTMGGGSYMEFTSTDDSIDYATRIRLMDAIRVGFVDDQGNLLGVAKLNTSNRVIEEGVIKAPLYLYDYSFSTELENEGAMIMGERHKEDNTIASLDQNIAKAITAMVWMDGDLVDNTMVSADRSATLGGTLNLQFSTDANLVPANDSALKGLETNKLGLEMLFTQVDPIYIAGQGTYTTTSWTEFSNAYNYATSVYNNPDSNDTQVKMAVIDLATAKSKLENISTDTLSERIKELREFVGTTDSPSYYVIYNSEESKYELVTGSVEEAIKGEIKRVDNNKNLQDEGNNYKTPIYTDASWDSLAEAIYRAELLLNYNYEKTVTEAKETALDVAITALDEAYEALERNVYYVAYDYHGSLYYMAIANKDEVITDTYGKWYDSEFKRVVSDLRILELDADAVRADVADISYSRYVSRVDVNPNQFQNYYYFGVNPYVYLNDDYYWELRNDEIASIGWKTYSSNFVNSVTEADVTYLESLVSRAKNLRNVVGNTTSETYLDPLIEYAEDVLYDSSFATSREYTIDDVIKYAEDNIATVEAGLPQMTTLQKTLLEAAVSKAYSSGAYDARYPITNDAGEVTGYGDYKYPALRGATTTAESYLATPGEITKVEARVALENINEQLEAAGETAVTELNAVVKSVPVDEHRYEPVFDVTSPKGMLHFKTQFGAATNEEISLTAVILTKKGVVYTTDPVTFEAYSRAGGVKIENGDITIAKGQTVNLSAVLEDSELFGNLPATETISSYSWSTENYNVYLDRTWISTVYDEAGNVVREGYYSYSYSTSDARPVLYTNYATTETIYLTVYTKEGNSYTDSIQVTITE